MTLCANDRQRRREELLPDGGAVHEVPEPRAARPAPQRDPLPVLRRQEGAAAYRPVRGTIRLLANRRSVTNGATFSLSDPPPLPSNRHHRSSGDCLERKRENYQVCSVQ